MTTYKLLKNFNGNIVSVLRNNKDSIPFDQDNTDYQVYRKWLSEGNEPLPAEETE